MSMSMAPVLLVNGLSQIGAAVASLVLAFRLRKASSCILRKPFFFLATAFLGFSTLNILWFFDLVTLSGWDHLIIGPLFNIIFLLIWFYTSLFISNHRHLYYLIPLFFAGVGAFFIFKNLAALSDILTGVLLVTAFFYLGFVDRHVFRWFSFIGMLYGFLLMVVSITSFVLGIPYLFSFWFIPTSAVLALLVLMAKKGAVCSLPTASQNRHVPAILEVFRFGFFVVSLSVLIMLGTLGIHEMGHSLAARAFGCSHTTEFGINFAVTHVTCSSQSGFMWITLAGFLLTVFVAFSLQVSGSLFAQRISWLMLAFGLIMAIDDFSKLSMPYSANVLIVIVSAALVVHGMLLIIKNYEREYESRESSVCMTAGCDMQNYLNSK